MAQAAAVPLIVGVASFGVTVIVLVVVYSLPHWSFTFTCSSPPAFPALTVIVVAVLETSVKPTGNV